MRNRKSISCAGSLTSDLRSCMPSRREDSDVFIYIHSTAILHGTSQSYIKYVIAIATESNVILPVYFHLGRFSKCFIADHLHCGSQK